MFDSELLAFYRKYCLAKNAKAKYKTAIPSKDRIQFVYTIDGEEIRISYFLSNLSEYTNCAHNKNIGELYDLSLGQYSGAKELSPIFISYCNTCGKLFFTKHRLVNGNTDNCISCEDSNVKIMIESGQTTNNVSYVYLIKNSTSRKVKIGISNNPSSRLKTLQTGNSDNLRISGLIRGGIKLEKSLHSMFSIYRVNGEWFEDVKDISDFFDNYA